MAKRLSLLPPLQGQVSDERLLAYLRENFNRIVDIIGVPIGTTDIADGAITTAKIADGAVTTPKIAANAVTNAKINSDNYGAAGYPLDVEDTEADGTATTLARSDHQHKFKATDVIIMERSSLLSLTAGTMTDVTFATADEIVKVGITHANNAADVTLTEAGIYIASAFVEIESATGQTATVANIVKNNTDNNANRALQDNANSPGNEFVVATLIETYAINDTIRLKVQAQGANADMLFARLSVVKIPGTT